MSLLSDLANLFHHHAQQQPAPQQAAPQQLVARPQVQHGYTLAQKNQMTPVGQPIPQQMMDSFSPQTKVLAQIYQNNPQDSRVTHIDPAIFGYRPDNAPSITQEQAFAQPQNGFGLQVQNVGGLPNNLQAPYRTTGNLTYPRNLVNPQSNDNGYFYN